MLWMLNRPHRHKLRTSHEGRGSLSEGVDDRRIKNNQFNIPITYSPKWSINVFDEEIEKEGRELDTIGVNITKNTSKETVLCRVAVKKNKA
jgi:hypothetical protein